MAKQEPGELKLVKQGVRHLPCALTDDEVLRAGNELAQTIEDMEAEEARATDVKAQLKASMTGFESRRSKLASKVRRREEYRDVDVHHYLHETDGMVHIIRADTGEEIEVRRPSQEELQPELALAD